jgi:hypothetical protein
MELTSLSTRNWSLMMIDRGRLLYTSRFPWISDFLARISDGFVTGHLDLCLVCLLLRFYYGLAALALANNDIPFLGVTLPNFAFVNC